MFKHLVSISTLAVISAATVALAQGPSLCPNPPCAPGVAIYRWENGGTPTVKVKCYNTSIYNCFSVEAGVSVVHPSDILPGTEGRLIVNDEDGRPAAQPVNVRYRSRDEGDGTFLFDVIH